MHQTHQVLEAYRDSPGHLMPMGVIEHRKLADRMYKRYKRVFSKGNKKIHVESSNVPRVLVSMASFTTELSSRQRDLDYTFESDEKVFKYINNTSSREHSRAVHDLLDSIARNTPMDTVQIYRRLFTDYAKGKALAPSAGKLLNDIWWTARTAKACETDGSPYDFVSEDIIYRWWADELRYIYLKQCNSVDYKHLRVPRTKPLVDVVFQHLDDAVDSAPVAANLMFGHDYPLLGLACWLGLEGIAESYTVEEIPEKWNDPTNVSFASNLQIVLYRNKKGEVLAKFVYNGRERAVNRLDAVSGPYYRWEDVSTLRNNPLE